MKNGFVVAITMVLAVTLAVIPVFAEGSKDDVKNGRSDSAKVVTITFWDENAGPERTPHFEKMIEKFHDQNPNIHINYVGLPWSDAKSKYDVAIQSRTTPDIGGIAQSWLSDFVVRGAVIPLDDMFNTWPSKDDYISAYLDSIRSCAADGKLYALTNTGNLPVLWYRPDVLEQKNIPLPKNWEDVFATIVATTDISKNMYGYSIRGGSGGTLLLEQLLYSYSGISTTFTKDGKSTINDKAHVDFLNRFVGLYNKYTPQSDITNGYKEMVAAFDSKVANMIHHNLGSYGEHKKTLGDGSFGAITSIKSIKGNEVVVTNGTVCYTVFKTTKNPKETFQFLSFLCEAEQSLFWNQNVGQLPTIKKALDSDYVKGVAHLNAAAKTMSDPAVQIINTPFHIPGYADLLNNDLTAKFQSVLLGKMTPKDFLDYWANQMTKLKLEYDTYFKK